MLLEKSQIIVKKSKFIAILYNISDLDEIEQILKDVKKKHNKSKHICSAYYFKDEEKFKNDGEVGAPGKILLEILKRKNLNSHFFVLIRYYGGVDLGMGGVARACRDVGREVIEKREKLLSS